MHRELKLQHALLQQVAQKVGVSEEATAEMRQLVEEAPEGAPVAARLRRRPLSKDIHSVELTNDTATTSDTRQPSSSTDLVEKDEENSNV